MSARGARLGWFAVAAAAACGGDPAHAPDAGGSSGGDAPLVRDAPPATTPDAPLELADVDPTEHLQAGTATTFVRDATAFVQPLAGLVGEPRTRYRAGQAVFDLEWIAATAASDRDGLGPTFNAISCRACHVNNGRGAPPADGGALVTTLLRVGPDPIYGDQIQNRAVTGVPAEGVVRMRYAPQPGAFPDGAAYELLVPSVELELLLGDPGPLAMSVRIAPQVIGQGLLDAIPAAAIRAAADPDDSDGNGVSGRAADLPDGALGRFGWKAAQPSVELQSSAAMIGDLGITTPRHPAENCPAPQATCAAAPSGGAPELTQLQLDAVDAFVIATTVPARRDPTAREVRRGSWLFRDVGCASCHTPRWQTAAVAAFPGIADQTIWPYTDLLLHDLGDGLADGRPEGAANGREWRTPPLWGIGLLPVVSGHLRLLHDGRARSFAEAILWHGGEAARSTARYRALSASDRAALDAFLLSL